jgi:hypothetical protein
VRRHTRTVELAGAGTTGSDDYELDDHLDHLDHDDGTDDHDDNNTENDDDTPAHDAGDARARVHAELGH